MQLGRAWFQASVVCALFIAPLQLAAQTENEKVKTHSLKEASTDFREGFAARQSGNLELARAKFAQVTRLEPGIPEGHEALGAVLLEMGKTNDAINELENAAKLQPNDAGNQANLALAYAQTSQPDKAIPHFELAVQLADKPSEAKMSAQFFEAYAHALAATGKPDAAITELKAEEALAGRQANVDDEIGSLYAQQGNWDAARSQFEHAISLDGSMVPARIHLGIVLRRQNDLADSLATLGTLAKLDPPNSLAVLEYGRTLAAAGKDDDAAQQFQKALKLDPQMSGAALELAMALQRMGRQQEAIPWFQQAIAQEPHNASALTNLGLALTLTGKAKEALASLNQAMALDPKDAVVYKDLGVAHVQMSAFDEAIGDFKKALTLDPNDPQLHYDLGLAYKFKDRYADAIAELTRAGQMDPALQDPPYTLGILLMQMGKLDDAVVELKKAVALRPENGDAWAILGSTLKQDARLPEAAEALKKAIPLLPGQPGPRVTLAGVLAEEAAGLAEQANAAEGAGNTQKAAALRSQMKDLRDQTVALRREGAVLAQGAVNRQRANFAMNAGNQLMLRGQIADAIARYQESIAADPSFADPHGQLAIAYERQGRADEAASEHNKAEELSKTN